jgi:hypothetical protein
MESDRSGVVVRDLITEHIEAIEAGFRTGLSG